ncbi:MAG: pyridoxamine kinase [Lachnospiraceae bacterium]|nr:pyridoxamine kinase [Lachnospiraceae bacterium]
MKRVLTVQDISCLGKCSLTIALPVISAMGSETVILPTALLSTHTMFKNFTCRDLSDQIMPIARHWQQEGVLFDAIYTGYLGTEEEVDMVLELIKMFKRPETLVLIDPVMGDNGKLYAAFDSHYAVKNAELCAAADVIVPNITEACLMTGIGYRTEYDEAYIRQLLQALAGLGAKTVMLTGVSLAEGKTGVMVYDTGRNEYYSYQNTRIPASYHGTGDLFSSTLVGALMRGSSWQDAIKTAADFTAETIRVTMEDPKQPWYGVNFEETLKLIV